MTQIARRTTVAAALLSALLLPGCGGDDSSPTDPNARNAIVLVSVSPNPVVGAQNSLTLVVTASYKIILTELNGLGGEVVFVSSAVLDPVSGGQVYVNYYDGTDMQVFAGSKRLEPLGTLEVTHSISYTLPDLTKPAPLSISVQVRDDKGNLINQSLLVKIE
jgi:hypothetical protein